MSRTRRSGAGRRSLASILAASAAILAIAGSAVAGDVDWEQRTLRQASSTLQDADFAGTDVAAVWREGGDIHLRTSTNSGLTFRSMRQVAPDSRQAETDICGNDVYTTYARFHSGKGDAWELYVTRQHLAGAGRSTGFVAAEVQDPDVACTNGRVFVSWLQDTGSGWNVSLDHALRSDLDFEAGMGGSPSDDFGPTWEFAGQPILAGAGDRAYLLWEESSEIDQGPVRFKRYRVGSGASYPVTTSPQVVIAPIGSYPAMGAKGSKVVTAWTSRCGSLRVKVSNDHGATWSPRRELVHQDCNVGDAPSWVASNVAIRGNRVIVAYDGACGGIKSPPCAEERVVSTMNDFVSFTDVQLRFRNTFADFETGLLSVGGSGRLAMVEDVGQRIRFLRQQ